MTDDFRAPIRAGLAALCRDPKVPVLAKDTVWDVAWPLNRLTGAAEVEDRLWATMRTAFSGLYRRDLMFLGGQNNRAAGGLWCACVTHYVGNFDQPFLGIAPSGSLVFLRSGEFFRVENDQIVEAKVILDLPDLMRQAGQMPLPSLGTEITFPAPATQDGLVPHLGDSARSLALVEAMLGDLHHFDPETGESANQTGKHGYWHKDMMWYGPAGVGSNYLWSGFVKDHRAPFLHAFPDRKGGNHYCRFGDGDYAVVSGWPSMTMTMRAPYLGHFIPDKDLTLRVMDFYRTDGRQICENWVTLDYGDLFRQLGVNLIDAAG